MATRGGKNLTILGVGAIVITLITTSVSLMIYRLSGDIYLDRSRPGFLPDEDEVQEVADPSTTFTYPESGPIDKEGLDEYLRELEKVNSRLKSYSDPFAETSLSDAALGIDGKNAEATADDSPDNL